jgi:hypothetical protein
MEIRRRQREIDRLKKLASLLQTAIRQGDDTVFLGWGTPIEALPLVQLRLANLQAECNERRGENLDE